MDEIVKRIHCYFKERWFNAGQSHSILKIEIKNSFKRLAAYALIKIVIMRTLAFLTTFDWFDLPIDICKITIWPTLAEALSVAKNQKSTQVIFVRIVLNLSYHSKTFEILYVLYKLFDLRTVIFGLQYSWFSVMKFGIQQVLVYVWNLNKNEWPTIFNNPKDIHTALTYQQIDALEHQNDNFNKNEKENLELAIGTTVVAHSIMTISTFGGMMFEMLNLNRMIESLKQWLLQ